MLKVVTLSTVQLSVIILSVVVLSVVMPSVTVLSVTESIKHFSEEAAENSEDESKKQIVSFLFHIRVELAPQHFVIVTLHLPPKRRLNTPSQGTLTEGEGSVQLNSFHNILST